MDWATTGTVGGSSQRRGRARRCGRCSLPPPTTRLVGGCGTGDRATKCGKLTGQFCSAGAKGQSFDPRPNWVCPNFGPFPSGEAALFWRGGRGGARGLWPRREGCAGVTSRTLLLGARGSPHPGHSVPGASPGPLLPTGRAVRSLPSLGLEVAGGAAPRAAFASAVPALLS